MTRYKIVFFVVLLLLGIGLAFFCYMIEKKLHDLETLRKELRDIETGKLEIYLKDIRILMSKFNQRALILKQYKTYGYAKETK